MQVFAPTAENEVAKNFSSRIASVKPVKTPAFLSREAAVAVLGELEDCGLDMFRDRTGAIWRLDGGKLYREDGDMSWVDDVLATEASKSSEGASRPLTPKAKVDDCPADPAEGNKRDASTGDRKTAWSGKLQSQYKDLEEFEAYDETYGLSKRLGYDSAEAAWNANPTVQGSTDPEDYKVKTAQHDLDWPAWWSAVLQFLGEDAASLTNADEEQARRFWEQKEHPADYADWIKYRKHPKEWAAMPAIARRMAQRKPGQKVRMLPQASIMYGDVAPNAEGTIIGPAGDPANKLVKVKWDDGHTSGVYPKHLTLAQGEAPGSLVTPEVAEGWKGLAKKAQIPSQKDVPVRWPWPEGSKVHSTSRDLSGVLKKIINNFTVEVQFESPEGSFTVPVPVSDLYPCPYREPSKKVASRLAERRNEYLSRKSMHARSPMFPRSTTGGQSGGTFPRPSVTEIEGVLGTRASVRDNTPEHGKTS